MTVEQPDISREVVSPVSRFNEIRFEAEVCFADRVKARTTFRITPIGLISTGLMVAAIIVSAAVRIRAAR
jgi:hypothetical protein